MKKLVLVQQLVCEGLPSSYILVDRNLKFTVAGSAEELLQLSKKNTITNFEFKTSRNPVTDEHLLVCNPITDELLTDITSRVAINNSEATTLEKIEAMERYTEGWIRRNSFSDNVRRAAHELRLVPDRKSKLS